MILTNEKMKNAIEKCHVIAPELSQQQINAILYHAHGVFFETEKIGHFEFMGIKICDVTKENFEAVSILKEATQSMLSPSAEKDAEIKSLKNALHDVLKAIIKPDNGVEDTIWVHDCSPIGDFIMGFLDEDIDLDALQNAPYRCKQTAEMFSQPIIEGLEIALDCKNIQALDDGKYEVGIEVVNAAQAYLEIQQRKKS